MVSRESISVRPRPNHSLKDLDTGFSSSWPQANLRYPAHAWRKASITAFWRSLGGAGGGRAGGPAPVKEGRAPPRPEGRALVTWGTLTGAVVAGTKVRAGTGGQTLGAAHGCPGGQAPGVSRGSLGLCPLPGPVHATLGGTPSGPRGACDEQKCPTPQARTQRHWLRWQLRCGASTGTGAGDRGRQLVSHEPTPGATHSAVPVQPACRALHAPAGVLSTQAGPRGSVSRQPWHRLHTACPPWGWWPPPVTPMAVQFLLKAAHRSVSPQAQRRPWLWAPCPPA